MDPVHGRARADHGVEAKDGLVRVLCCQPVHQADLRPNRPSGPGGSICNHRLDVLSRTVVIGCLYHLHRAFRMNKNVHVGVLLSSHFDLIDSEASVH